VRRRKGTGENNSGKPLKGEREKNLGMSRFEPLVNKIEKRENPARPKEEDLRKKRKKAKAAIVLPGEKGADGKKGGKRLKGTLTEKHSTARSRRRG